MRIGESVYHFPTNRKGVCKGLPSGRGTVRVWVGGAIEMINQRELRRSSGMAKVVEEFPRRTRKHTHDWDKYFDGRIWEVRQGVDFTQTPQVFRSGAHTAARHRGLKIQTHLGGKSAFIRKIGERSPE